MSKVGIIANPVSARDIRRIVSHAGNLPINDRANIVLRLLTGLFTAGVRDVLIMPENGGIRTQLMRTIKREAKVGEARFPQVSYLDMPVTCTSDDSARAARMMREAQVGAIVVLGGDGTNRVVVSECGNIPVSGVSTGTNNAFPEMREPTITGLAVGLAVTRQIPCAHAFTYNKRLEVKVNDQREIALVDVAVVAERFVGARAIWKTENFRDLFTTFGAPDGIGMSSIVGLLAPLRRDDPEGRRIQLRPLEGAHHTINAPIAPGLIEAVGIGGVETILPDQIYMPSVSAGSIALDGEREMTFSEIDEVSIRLQVDAFRTINIPECMAYAARHGLLTNGAQDCPQTAQPHGRTT
ncbi:NAD(+)/NADH kinase [Ruegeria sp. HKCCD8929]|uniref:ATP-NAD kinase family protein n=1 Tax=Ruegeria sp. HKCCD8929 TaxID=2683006 RepID=UPI001489DEB6